MDNVEKHVLFENSGKTQMGLRVKERKMNPQKREVIHAGASGAGRMRTEMWIKITSKVKKIVAKVQILTVLHIYTAHTSVCMGIYPHISPGVDDCSQVLSTARGQTKKRRIKSLFGWAAGKTTNEKTSYPQIVQYLWITHLVA